jgi:hypothetical protein
MKPVDRSLEILLAAAAKTRGVAPEAPPFGFETAFLARWRAARLEDDSAVLLWLFQRAMILAVAVMMLSGAWIYFAGGTGADTTALASYALTQLPP